jgi:hypothetical protein
VGVEKLCLPQNSRKLGDRKYLGKLNKWFVGHPDAILFLRISPEGVFQHPQAIALKIPQGRIPPVIRLASFRRSAVLPLPTAWEAAANGQTQNQAELQSPSASPTGSGSLQIGSAQ